MEATKRIIGQAKEACLILKLGAHKKITKSFKEAKKDAMDYI